MQNRSKSRKIMNFIGLYGLIGKTINEIVETIKQLDKFCMN